MSNLRRKFVSSNVSFPCLGSIYSNSVTTEVALNIVSFLRSKLTPYEDLIVVDGPVFVCLFAYRKQLKIGRLLNLVILNVHRRFGYVLATGYTQCEHDVVVRFEMMTYFFLVGGSKLKMLSSQILNAA